MYFHCLSNSAPMFLLFKEACGEKYLVIAPGDHDNTYLMIHIISKDVRARGIMQPASDQWGICLDIFLIENTPDNAVLRKMHGAACMGYRYVLSCLRLICAFVLISCIFSGIEILSLSISPLTRKRGNLLCISVEKFLQAYQVQYVHRTPLPNFRLLTPPLTDIPYHLICLYYQKEQTVRSNYLRNLYLYDHRYHTAQFFCNMS